MTDSKFKIAVIKGDGIGVDVTESTLAVLDAAQARVGGYKLNYIHLQAGAAYYQETGQDIAMHAQQTAEAADAIFLGAIGLPHIRYPDGTEISPHLRLRERLQLYAGVRPVRVYPNTPQRLADPRAADIDLIVLRESTEGFFYSASTHNRSVVVGDYEVKDTVRISRPTTEKLHDFAFRLATKRKRHGGKGIVTCVDKANVFQTMAFFRKIFDERAVGFPDIKATYQYVDAQALELVRQPWNYDVLVMENMFGDILSELASGLVGGMGMASCAEIGDNHGLFQPAHGSAPDIMGQDKANPLAAILSGILMLDYLSERSGLTAPSDAAKLINAAIEQGLADKRIQPMEFGGNQGTKSVTHQLLDIVSKLNV